MAKFIKLTLMDANSPHMLVNAALVIDVKQSARVVEAEGTEPSRQASVVKLNSHVHPHIAAGDIVVEENLDDIRARLAKPLILSETINLRELKRPLETDKILYVQILGDQMRVWLASNFIETDDVHKFMPPNSDSLLDSTLSPNINPKLNLK